MERETTIILDKIRPFLAKVTQPAQYLGGEIGRVVKSDDEVDQRWALLFPDTYAIGMSHLGIKILYGVLNGIDGVAAERGFAPWTDMEEEMRRAGVPLFTLETHRPVREFDVVGFSLQYELSYTNVLAMLDLAGIPLTSEARGEEDPIVMAGGMNAFHPEPIAEFIDVFLLGDGEDAIPDMVAILRRARGEALSRRETLLTLAREVTGVYVPSLYEARYDETGRLVAMAPTEDGVPERVGPAHVSDLEEAYFPIDPPVPHVRVTQDRIIIEVMRGCTQGCRFCQAGMLKRPTRVRSVDRIVQIAKESYRKTGYDEISLLSLSTADYPYLTELTEALDREFKDRRVGISVPSLRVSETLKSIPALVNRVRKATLTVAPEVATDRLRAVIDKNITNEDLYAGVREIYAQGWKGIKLYFMIGLPTETDEDVRGIIEMGRRVGEIGKQAGGGRANVTISVSNFVPKPHTPFQWEPMDSKAELIRKRGLLYDEVRPHRNLKLKVHDAARSRAEGLLARGDRHLSRVLVRLMEKGARFDSWDDQFNENLWAEAIEAEGIDPAAVLETPRDENDTLPWDHLGAPVSRAFLESEWRKAKAGERTESCMDDRCNHCGVDVRECRPTLAVLRQARGANATVDDGESTGE